MRLLATADAQDQEDLTRIKGIGEGNQKREGMKKYRNKYRIASARAQWWDYGWHAAYFVTVCTQNREHFFGEIVDGVMVLSAIGQIVESEWLKTFEMRPDMNLHMGEYVVMPNHFHAIVGIGANKYNSGRGAGRDTATTETTGETGTTGDTGNNAKRGETEKPKNRFGPQSKNLASIIRGFKIGVTKNARLIDPDFAWQPRFHDHIIRNDAEYRRISIYIVNNPANWK